MVDQLHSRAAGRAIQEIPYLSPHGRNSPGVGTAFSTNAARRTLFYNEFFQLFGVTRRRVASFEHGVNLPEKSAAISIFFGRASFSSSNVAPAVARASGCASRSTSRRRRQTQARPEKVKAGPSSLAATMAATISNELISLHAEFLEWMLALILAIN
jgi:hypothetical protein